MVDKERGWEVKKENGR